MKRTITILSICVFFTQLMFAQTNTLPSSGNVGIGCDRGSTLFKVYKSELPTIELASSISRLQFGLATCNDCFAIGAVSGDAIIRTFGPTHNTILAMPDNNNDGKSFIGFADDANGIWLKIFNNKIMRANGTIIASKVMVKTDVWSDYVFNPEYKLKSLSEIDSYIKENRHLPDVPTANEVIEHGIDVAQMNAILLKKVEELTLLMINQNKTIGLLENKINEMHK